MTDRSTEEEQDEETDTKEHRIMEKDDPRTEAQPNEGWEEGFERVDWAAKKGDYSRTAMAAQNKMNQLEGLWNENLTSTSVGDQGRQATNTTANRHTRPITKRRASKRGF